MKKTVSQNKLALLTLLICGFMVSYTSNAQSDQFPLISQCGLLSLFNCNTQSAQFQPELVRRVDITRDRGNFTPRQRDMYEAYLETVAPFLLLQRGGALAQRDILENARGDTLETIQLLNGVFESSVEAVSLWQLTKLGPPEQVQELAMAGALDLGAELGTQVNLVTQRNFGYPANLDEDSLRLLSSIVVDTATCFGLGELSGCGGAVFSVAEITTNLIFAFDEREYLRQLNAYEAADIFIHTDIRAGNFNEITTERINLIVETAGYPNDFDRDYAKSIILQYHDLLTSYVQGSGRVVVPEGANFEIERPLRPQNLQVDSNQRDVSVRPIMTIGAYRDENPNATHASTRWVIRDPINTRDVHTDTDFISDGLTRYIVEKPLVDGQTYEVFVQVANNFGEISASTSQIFTVGGSNRVDKLNNFLSHPLDTGHDSPIFSLFDNERGEGAIGLFDHTLAFRSSGESNSCFKLEQPVGIPTILGPSIVSFPSLNYIGMVSGDTTFACSDNSSVTLYYADTGTIVRSGARGRIVNVEENSSSPNGCSVSVNHGNGFQTTYSNLNCSIPVSDGMDVKKSDTLGFVPQPQPNIQFPRFALQVVKNCEGLNNYCSPTEANLVDPYNRDPSADLWSDWEFDRLIDPSGGIELVSATTDSTSFPDEPEITATVQNPTPVIQENLNTIVSFYASQPDENCGTGELIGTTGISAVNSGELITEGLTASILARWTGLDLTAVLDLGNGVTRCVRGAPIAENADQGVVQDILLSNLEVEESSVNAGFELDIEFEIIYEGEESERLLSRNEVYLSTDRELDSSDVLIGSSVSSIGIIDRNEREVITSNIPSSILPGSYHILAVTNAARRIDESDYSNNYEIREIEVSVIENNRVSALSPDTFNFHNRERFEWSATVQRSSSNTQLQQIEVGIFLSDDPFFSIDDQFVDRETISLTRTESDQVTGITNFPDGVAPGTKYLLAVSDFNNQFAETNETDNVRAREIEVLRFGDVSLDLSITNGSLGIGEVFSVFGQVDYEGTFDVDNANFLGVSCFVSIDENLSNDDVFVGFQSTPVFTGLPTVNFEDRVRIPPTLTPGQYFLICKVDAENRYFEFRENNNTVTIELDLSVQNDFVPISLRVPNFSFFRGERIRTDIRISGSVVSTRDINYPISVYFSEDRLLDAQDIELFSDEAEANATSPDDIIITSVTIPSGIEPGEYFLILAVDSNNSFPEVSEDNNTLVQSIGVEVQVFSNPPSVFNQQIGSPDPILDSQFGQRLATSGDWLVAASPEAIVDGISDAGSLQVFRRDTENQWEFFQTLIIDNPQRRDFLGRLGVGIDGDTIVASTPFRDSESGNDSGFVYVFELSQGRWSQTQRLNPPSEFEPDLFGSQLSVENEILVVADENARAIDESSTGVISTFHRVNGAWVLLNTLRSETGINDFGARLASDGNTLVAGNFSGSYEVYRLENEQWNFVQTLTGTSNTAIAVQGNQIVIPPTVFERSPSAVQFNSSYNIDGLPTDRANSVYISSQNNLAAFGYSRLGDNGTGLLAQKNESNRFQINSVFSELPRTRELGEAVTISDDERTLFVSDADGNFQIQERVGSIFTFDVSVDTDQDGVPDFEDNCPIIANPDQANYDGDDSGDVCDDDIDNDNIENMRDCDDFNNQRWTLETLFTDIDSDGIGIFPSMEICIGLPATLSQLAPIATDNCPLVSNSDQSNNDNDTLGDVCDNDDDNDGIPDNVEIDNELNPFDPSDATLDSDGDGRDNLTEFRDGTDLGVPDLAPQFNRVLIGPLFLLLNNDQ